MRESNLSVCNLPPVRLSCQLQEKLVDLSSSRSAYWVSFRFEPTARVYWNGAANVCGTTFNELTSLTRLAETQVFIGDYLCDCEAVVDFGNVDVLRFDVGHLVGLLGCLFCGVDGREAVTLVEAEGVLGLSRPDNVNVVVAQLLREFWIRKD